jgi:GDPmannose 4,6-dehydratase
VRELCEVAFDRAGLNWEDHVVIDERFFRPAEVDLLVGDSSKARAKIGWKTEVGFADLIQMMVDADIDLLRS